MAGFWPLEPSPPGSQLEIMYGKILKKMAEAEDDATGVNGQAKNKETPSQTVATITT